MPPRGAGRWSITTPPRRKKTTSIPEQARRKEAVDARASRLAALQSAGVAFFAAGGGDVAAHLSQLVAAGADRREAIASIDAARETAIWGRPLPGMGAAE